MAKLFINPDGANPQAQAVLAYLRHRDGIEPSWNGNKYEAEPQVDRWHNCREQGYVISLRGQKTQLNIAFFEHRNSDAICAVKWEGFTLNPPTIDDIPSTHPFSQSKWDTDFDVAGEHPAEMAEWIYSQMVEFWLSHALPQWPSEMKQDLQQRRCFQVGWGLTYCVWCAPSDWTIPQIEDDVSGRYPSGTPPSQRWQVSSDTVASKHKNWNQQTNRKPCPDDPDRVHVLLNC